MDTIEEKKEILRNYASLKERISKLEDEIDLLKPQIEVIIVELNPTDNIVEAEWGMFSLVPKRKYTYTEATKEAEKALKARKADEEATGEATYTVNPYVLFKAANIN